MFRWSLSQELNKYKPVTEAPEDNSIDTGVTNDGDTPSDLGGSTDYAAAAKEMDDANQDGEADEGTESAEEEPADDSGEDDLDAEDYGDEEGEGDDLESEDYGEEGEGEEDPEENTTEEEVPSETGDKSRNRFLIKEFISLYDQVDNIIIKLNNKFKTEILSNRVYLQVIDNLTEMNAVLLDYIKDDFSNKSYVFNLYQLNLFLEYINVNAEMLNKSVELQSKEQTNK